MIDRMLGSLLGQIAPGRANMLDIGLIAVGAAGALWMWGEASKGKSLTVAPWMLRMAAVAWGGTALLRAYRLRAPASAPTPAPAGPAPASAGYGLAPGSGYGYGYGGWR